ncbi:MAG: hypothetical protein R3B45_01145 [Bdellovibrionota bacterium]
MSKGMALTLSKDMPMYVLQAKESDGYTWGEIIVPKKIRKKIFDVCDVDGTVWVAVSGKFTANF